MANQRLELREMVQKGREIVRQGKESLARHGKEYTALGIIVIAGIVAGCTRPVSTGPIPPASPSAIPTSGMSGEMTVTPTATQEPTSTASATPKVNIINAAAQPMNCQDPPAAGVCEIIAVNQGEYQGMTAWEAMTQSLGVSNTNSFDALKGAIGATQPEKWISHSVFSDTLNIARPEGIQFYNSTDAALNLDAPKGEKRDVIVVARAADAVKVLNKQVDAITNAQMGSEQMVGTKAYFDQWTKNWLDLSRKLGVRLIKFTPYTYKDKDGKELTVERKDTVEPVFLSRDDVKTYEESDFEVGLLTRDLNGNPAFSNPIGGGVLEIYRVRKSDQVSVPVKTSKVVYKLDEKTNEWVLDKQIPVGDEATANKDKATMVFVSSWRRHTSQNLLQLRAVLIAQNEYNRLGKKGAVEWLYGLYPTGPLPSWKQTILTLIATSTPTRVPTQTSLPTGTTTGGGEGPTPTPGKKEPTGTLPPTNTRAPEASHTPQPPTTHPTDIVIPTDAVNTPNPNATPNKTAVPAATQPGRTPRPTDIIATPALTPAP